jgi:hypothetical protein
LLQDLQLNIDSVGELGLAMGLPNNSKNNNSDGASSSKPVLSSPGVVALSDLLGYETSELGFVLAD